jgi:hypothetical protein
MATFPNRQPDRPYRQHAALVSYWLLFIFLPLGGFLVWRGITTSALGLLLPLFFVLVLIGEHGLRLWKRL